MSRTPSARCEYARDSRQQPVAQSAHRRQSTAAITAEIAHEIPLAALTLEESAAEIIGLLNSARKRNGRELLDPRAPTRSTHRELADRSLDTAPVFGQSLAVRPVRKEFVQFAPRTSIFLGVSTYRLSSAATLTSIGNEAGSLAKEFGPPPARLTLRGEELFHCLGGKIHRDLVDHLARTLSGFDEQSLETGHPKLGPWPVADNVFQTALEIGFLGSSQLVQERN
jgi:hypothetical protein